MGVKMARKYKLDSIKRSTKDGKKYMATFTNKKTGRSKTTHFGAAGMSDYTKHKDDERKKRYLSRHRSTEDWNDPVKAGTLSRYVLWNKKGLRASISDYKRRFNFD